MFYRIVSGLLGFNSTNLELIMLMIVNSLQFSLISHSTKYISRYYQLL